MQVDLPALDRPTKANSGTSSAGKWCSCAAVVKNRVVCSQAMASLASSVLVGALAYCGALRFKAESLPCCASDTVERALLRGPGLVDFLDGVVDMESQSRVREEGAKPGQK